MYATPLFYPYYIGLMWMGVMTQMFQRQTSAFTSLAHDAVETGKENVKATENAANSVISKNRDTLMSASSAIAGT
jgi:hypothetical protein